MLLQPITVPFSKSTLKPSVYTLSHLGHVYLNGRQGPYCLKETVDIKEGFLVLCNYICCINVIKI